MADKTGWTRLKSNYSGDYWGARKGIVYHFWKDTNIDNLTIWVMNKGDQFEVQESFRKGFEDYDTTISGVFKKATDAKKWADENYKEMFPEKVPNS